MTVWSLLIWSFAVRNPRNMKMRDAFICAAIPTVIFDSYQLLSLTRVALRARVGLLGFHYTVKKFRLV